MLCREAALARSGRTQAVPCGSPVQWSLLALSLTQLGPSPGFAREGLGDFGPIALFL